MLELLYVFKSSMKYSNLFLVCFNLAHLRTMFVVSNCKRMHVCASIVSTCTVMPTYYSFHHFDVIDRQQVCFKYSVRNWVKSFPNFQHETHEFMGFPCSCVKQLTCSRTRTTNRAKK